MIQFKSGIVLQVIDNIYIISMLWYGYSCSHRTGMSSLNIVARANIPYILKSLCSYNELFHLTWIDPSSSCPVLSVKKSLGWRNVSAQSVAVTYSVSPTRTCWAAAAGPRGGDTWPGAADLPVRHHCALIIRARDWGVKLKRTKRQMGKKEKFKWKVKLFSFSKKKKGRGGFKKNSEIKNPLCNMWSCDHFL